MAKVVSAVPVLLLLLAATVLGATDTEISAALALFPIGQDVAVSLSDEGKTALESAIEVLEDALGVAVLFNHSNEDDYRALNIDFDKKPWVNMLSQGC